jgi:hypothetical protein
MTSRRRQAGGLEAPTEICRVGQGRLWGRRPTVLLLGGIAVLIPRFSMMKEWAYAGMAFDLTGASASHAATGDPAAKVATPLIILLNVIASWALRPESRRLRDAGLK